jgi:hypothetical protein
MATPIMMLSIQQQASINTYEKLVCYLLSFRKAAEGLYDAWLKSKDMIAKGNKLNYTFTYLNNSVVFSWCQLSQLELASRCPSLNDLLLNSNTIEGVAIVLFKLRIQLMNLYKTYLYGKEMHSRGNKYIYTFVNPFIGQSNASNLASITGVFKMNTDCIIRLFECCYFEPFIFGPLSNNISGLPNGLFLPQNFTFNFIVGNPISEIQFVDG